MGIEKPFEVYFRNKVRGYDHLTPEYKISGFTIYPIRWWGAELSPAPMILRSSMAASLGPEDS